VKNVQVLRKEPLIRDRVLCSDGRAIVWLRVSLFNIDLLALDDESRYMSESVGRRVSKRATQSILSFIHVCLP